MPIDPQGITWDAPPQPVGEPVTGAADRPLRGGVIFTDASKQASEQRAQAGEARAAAGEARAAAAEQRAQAKFEKEMSGDKPTEQAYSQSAIDAFDRAINSAERLKTHPGFGAAVGSRLDPAAIVSYNPITGEPFSGTEARDFKAELDALKAQVFLPMVQSMKGMGQLSNAEGQKLTDAIGALDTGMSEQAFRASLERIQSDLRTYRDRGMKGAPPQAQEQRIPGAGAPADMQVAEGGTYSTPNDIEVANRLQEAWRGGATVDQMVEIAKQYGHTILPQDIEQLRQDKNRIIQFNPAASGRRSELGQAMGDIAASPVGSYAVGAANALTAGTMDELAPLIGLSQQQVQAAKEYLAQKNPVASLAGEVTGGAMAMLPINRALGAAGMGARTALAGDVAYGAAYGAGESNENRLAGALLGGGVSGAAGAAARRFLPGASAPRTSTNMEDIALGGLPEAEQAGIRVMTSDVRPPDTFIGRTAQRFGERVPFVGTGGARAAQQEERTAAVQDVLREFNGVDAAELPAKVMQDLTEKRSAELTKFSQMKREVIGRLGQVGEVPVTKAQEQIGQEIARLERISPEGFAPAVSLLRRWGADLQGKTLDDIEVLRKQIGEAFKAPELSAIRGEAEAALSRIYGPLREDMGNFIKANGEPADFNKWMIANKRLAEMSGELGVGTLRNVLRSGEATPEVVERLLFSAKPSDVRLLYRNLTPAGRVAAQGAIMGRALKNMGGDLDAVTPEKFITQMKKLGTQTGVFFNGDEAARINGLVKALKLTQRAGEAGVVTKTGQEAAPFAAGAFMQSTFGAMALPATAIGGLLARAYESKATRNMLLNLGRAKPGSEAESALAQKVAAAIRSLATASTVKAVADTTPQAPSGGITTQSEAQ